MKTGSIIGTIGGVAMICLMLLLAGGQLSASKTASDSTTIAEVTVTPDAGAAVVLPVVLGFVSSCAVTVLFVVGLARGSKMGKRSATRLSVSAIVVSAIGLFGLVSFYGVIAICGGWLFLWQPVLELIGAIKMYQGASRYEDE